MKRSRCCRGGWKGRKGGARETTAAEERKNDRSGRAGLAQLKRIDLQWERTLPSDVAHRSPTGRVDLTWGSAREAEWCCEDDDGASRERYWRWRP